MTSPNVKDDIVHFKGEPFELYLSEEDIAERIRQIGKEIDRDYTDKTPILIGVLNGAFMFMADLLRAITVDCEVDFLKLSSYGAQKVSSGEVTQLKKIDADIKDRDVIVVEDIVDTGLSMQYMLDNLEAAGPSSIRVATLLHKPESSGGEVPIDYLGFDIPNLFVIGYGMDYGQIGRNLPEIYMRRKEED